MRPCRLLLALLLLPASLPLAACDDTTGFGRATIVTDTITIGAPTVVADTVPTALDIVYSQGAIGGGRFPERPREADQWDVALRLSGGQLSLAPRGAVGVDSRRAGITEALPNTTFERLEEAPASSRFVTDRAIPLTMGSVYAVRSRSFSSFGGACFQYAKLQPLELNVAAGTARLEVATSAGFCGDTRLVED
ncbi:MAG TPA: hypothetical protein VHG28_16135 [Longimicrobiaceae bacterium]|nr:hypothetical protein [Longimicrobiaceae bacterium]